MNAFRTLLGAIAAAAGCFALSAGAQPYGHETSCYYVAGALRCEEQTFTPRGYMGDHKWCLYRGGTLGETALCSYPTYRECLVGRGPVSGRCILNPNHLAAAPPPPPRPR
jgi:hypothetical protein